jgi:hypothetical protein
VLAINAASAATVKTTGAIVNAVDGIIRSKAALSAQALSALAAADLPSSGSGYVQPAGITGFYVQPAQTTAYYVLVMNAAQTVKVVQGTWRKTGVNAAIPDFQPIITPNGISVVGDGNVPDVPDGVVPFGMIKVACGSAAFTPATTALDAANITFTFYDLMCLPATERP